MGKSGNPAKRAEQENPAPVDYDPTPVDEQGVEDFDAFWQTEDAKRDRVRVKIRGQVVELPPALPLEFELVSRRKAKSRKASDIEHMVGLLFGHDQMRRWAKAGMDGEEFAVLLAWATQRIGGGDMSMAEVAAKLEEADQGEA